MRFVIFGLTVSSSWGNGHATTWRGLLKGLRRQGHVITFFERDVPYYAAARDLPAPDFCELVLYQDWAVARARAERELTRADVAIVSSFCPDGLAAAQLVLDSDVATRAFYDIDTPVTMASLIEHGLAVPQGAHYLTPALIPEYDLYLSFAGGAVLTALEQRWGARRAAPLYCAVDPEVHRPVPPDERFRCTLGYIGTYAESRQAALEQLLIEPARRCLGDRFVVIGPQYPADIAWPPNVARAEHLPPAEHAGFYCANRITLNVTRQEMVALGSSPSVRLFEAASCGVPILSDVWAGLDDVIIPGEEILVAHSSEEAIAALATPDAELRRIAERARDMVLAWHTGDARARELVELCQQSARAGVG